MKKQKQVNARTKPMNRRCFIVRLIALTMMICAIWQTTAFAWDSDHSHRNNGTVDRNFENPKGTHQWVASRGFEILNSEKPKAFEWLNNQGVNISTIVKYTDRPDVLSEAEFMANLSRTWHFYVVDDKNDSISDTAVERFIVWYNAAVYQYNSGEKVKAYQSLGTALHYISDLCVPVHTGEKVSILAYLNPVQNTLHEQYEKDAEGYRNTAAATVSRGGQYTWAVSNSLRTIAIQAAKDSAEYYQVINEYAFVDAYIEAITQPLKNTQLACAQVLYRFYIDVTGIEDTKYVTVSGKNTPVWSEPQSTGSSKQVATLAAGTIVTIASTQRNNVGNLWGRVAGKDCYIFMDNLTTYKPPVLTPLASDKRSYVTTQKNVVVYTEPSSYSAISRTIANENSAITITSTTINAAGNLWGKIEDGEYIFMGSVKASSSTTTEPPQPQTPTQSLSVTNTVDGSFIVTVPANYRVDCFKNPTDTTRSTYISAKSAPYMIPCTKRLTMSNGTTRYFFRSGDNKDLYFVFTNSMSVTPTTEPTQPQTPTQSLSVTNTVDGSFIVTVPANYMLDCFKNPTDTTRSTYISAKSAPYLIPCTKRLTMSNGTTRYFFRSGDNKDLYFVFTNSMSVTSPTTPTLSTVTIMYNANGGSGAPASHITTKDDDGVARFTLSTTIPTRSGYTFSGWRLNNSTAYDIYSPGQNVAEVLGNQSGNDTLTYYAQWNNDTFNTLRYDANGGIGAPPDQITRSGTSWTISSIIPTRNGYAFEGWAEVPNTTYPAIYPGQTFGRDRDLMLYAVWSARPDDPPPEPSLTFYRMDARWDIAYSQVIDKGYYEVISTFGCNVDASCDQPVTEYGLILLDSAKNQIASSTKPVSYGGTTMRGWFGIYEVTSYSYSRLETPTNPTPLPASSEKSILAALENGKTYYWYVYVISNGQRLESTMQSFVFTK